MAVNALEMISNINSFIDFDGKTVAIVGAGGGQLVGYGSSAIKIIAIDNEPTAIKKLETAIAQIDNRDKYEIVFSDFFDYSASIDLLVFEFSLHEMKNIKRAIEHAKVLAKEVFVLDHENKGEWIEIVQERDMIEDEDNAIELNSYKKKKAYRTIQRFSDYELLKSKVEVQGQNAISAIEKYREAKDIEIVMYYKIVEL